MRPLCVLFLTVILAGVCSSPLVARQNDGSDEELRSGLVARYSAGDRVVERVDAVLAFDWGTSAPDPRLPTDGFQALWQGRLLVRQPGRYRLHVYLEGQVHIQVAGREVLSAKAATAGWHSGESFELAFGEKPLRVEFTRTGSRARLLLCWSSKDFPLEPIPAHLLFRAARRSDLDKIDRGRQLFASHRCNRCHQRANDPLALPGPDLSAATIATNQRSLVAQIVEPGRNGPHARMPRMGLLGVEAEAIVGWLASRSRSVSLLPVPPIKAQDRAKYQLAGQLLLQSLGCLACHRVQNRGGAGLSTAPDLSRVGQRRSPAWLATWLKNPALLNRDHRMPVFTLSDTERAQLVLALSALGGPFVEQSIESSPAQVRRGAELVKEANCARCHRLPGKTVVPSAARNDLSRTPEDWKGSCLEEMPDRKRWRPAAGPLSKSQREAVRAFVISRDKTELSPPSAYDRGRDVLERRNCLSCHSRGTARGNAALAGEISKRVSGLKGQSQALIPPSLTSVGDKLVDEALVLAISGRQKRVRLPWLKARMPRFEHSDQDRQALKAYLVAHDRIPAKAPSTPRVAARPGDETMLVLGQELVGAKGFSCIACHRVGSYAPRNVALGTRGSDLTGLAGRLRREYFMRWCRSPLRIVPGMEMPSYIKAVPGLLGADADRQLAATWDALNDPRFQPPTNPTAVEQFLVVGAGGRTRLVRDVFTNPKANGGGTIARGLAVGFSNGHNLLYDLDVGRIALWTFGDFARQRTQGKSWFWDMAGSPVMAGDKPQADLVLVRSDQQRRPVEVMVPFKDTVTACELHRYRQDVRGRVEMTYRLTFVVEGKKRGVEVRERLGPMASEKSDTSSSGWQRGLSVTLPAESSRDWQVYVARPAPTTKLGSPIVTAWSGGEDSERREEQLGWTTLPGQGQRQFVRLPVPDRKQEPRRAVLRYACQLASPRLTLKPAGRTVVKSEKVTTVPGFEAIRLPLPRSIMPTSLCWRPDGTLAMTSLKGHVYLARDTDGDGLEDRLQLFEEGLAAPYGILADGNDLLVAHKPEVLRLRDTDGDGRADVREVLGSGWGYSDDYHDWTCGLIRDKSGSLFVGLGSNYAQRNRPRETSRWRGKVLKISPGRRVEPVGHAFRYPTGLAIDDRGQIFVSDNQGVQNTFNEINHLVPGRNYGVPSRFEEKHQQPPVTPAIQVPHPWSRSVNGLFFLPGSFGNASLAGHGIGCEYDNRFLVRFTLQKVRGEYQGAVYHFSRPGAGAGGANFVGPLSGGVSPAGDIYIGNIFDSGWLGGRNTGTITRLRPVGGGPNGLSELAAVPGGFRLKFASAVDRSSAEQVASFTISGYTRSWRGGYTTPDSGRHRVTVRSATLSADGRHVTLSVPGLKSGYVYEVTCGKIGVGGSDLWPATGHYSLLRLPVRD